MSILVNDAQFAVLSGNLVATGQTLYNYVNNISGARLYIGSGNPEGIVSAISGSIYNDWFNQVQYNKFTGAQAYGWA